MLLNKKPAAGDIGVQHVTDGLFKIDEWFLKVVQPGWRFYWWLIIGCGWTPLHNASKIGN